MNRIKLVGLLALIFVFACDVTQPVEEISISGRWTSYDIGEKATFEQFSNDSAKFIIYEDDRGNVRDYKRGLLQKINVNAYRYITTDKSYNIRIYETYYVGGRLEITNGQQLNFIKLLGDQ